MRLRHARALPGLSVCIWMSRRGRCATWRDAELCDHIRDAQVLARFSFSATRYIGTEDVFSFSGNYYKGQDNGGWATAIPSRISGVDAQDLWLQVAQDLSYERWRLEERLEAAETSLGALRKELEKWKRMEAEPKPSGYPITNAISHSEPRTAWDRR